MLLWDYVYYVGIVGCALSEIFVEGQEVVSAPTSEAAAGSSAVVATSHARPLNNLLCVLVCYLMFVRFYVRCVMG